MVRMETVVGHDQMDFPVENSNVVPIDEYESRGVRGVSGRGVRGVWGVVGPPCGVVRGVKISPARTSSASLAGDRCWPSRTTSIGL